MPTPSAPARSTCSRCDGATASSHRSTSATRSMRSCARASPGGSSSSSDDDARPDYRPATRGRISGTTRAGPEEFLERQIAVRRAAIRRFGLGNIHVGRAGGDAAGAVRSAVLLPSIRGVTRWPRRSAGWNTTTPLPATASKRPASFPASASGRPRASSSSALAPAELAIPDTVVTLLGPAAVRLRPERRDVRLAHRPVFDEFGAAGSLATLVLGPLLQRDRLARLVQQSAHDAGPRCPWASSSARVERSVWDAPADRSPRNAALRRAVQRVYADRLLALAADTAAAPDVRAAVQLTLATLRREARARGGRLGLRSKRARTGRRSPPTSLLGSGTTAYPPRNRYRRHPAIRLGRTRSSSVSALARSWCAPPAQGADCQKSESPRDRSQNADSS